MSVLEWWPEAATRLLGGSPTLLALDFDGTLAPLVDDPEASRTLPQGQAALAALAQVPTLRLALVSGRPAGDLVRLAAPPEETLIAGSHGAELGVVQAGRLELQPHHLTPAQRSQLASFDKGLTELIQTHGSPAGAWVEHKPVAHVLHTRLVADAAMAADLTEAAQTLGATLGAHLLVGKSVVELAVEPAGKAEAIRYLRQLIEASIVGFAGDDTTDELALRTLEPPDVAIRVGPEPTAAEFTLADPPEMCAFLAYLVERVFPS